MPLARNPSISSAQLNAVAPLVRVTRIPSTRFDSIDKYQAEQPAPIEGSTVKSSDLRASIKKKAKHIFSKPALSTKPSSDKSGDLENVQPSTFVPSAENSTTNSSVQNIFAPTSKSLANSVVLVSQRPLRKSSVKSGEAKVQPSAENSSGNSVSLKSVSSTTSQSAANSVVSVKQRPKSSLVLRSDNRSSSVINPKYLARSNAFLRPREVQKFNRARGRYQVVSVPNSNRSSDRSSAISEQLLGSIGSIVKKR